MRSRRVRPALPRAVKITLTGRGDAHTGLTNTRRTGHRCLGQLVSADHDLRDRIDITPRRIGRITGTTELAARLAKTIGNRIGEILAVRANPAPLVLGNQF